MKKLLMVLPSILLASCGQDPVATKSTDNPNVPVGLMFEVDGCKVYRFTDASRFVYFTNCTGETTSYHTETCGKNCNRSVPKIVSTRRVSE
jgi:hypothetical protein